MKTIFMLSTLCLLSTSAFAQSGFYLKPEVGASWSSYKNSNPKITGSSEQGGNADWIFGLSGGYDFSNNLTLESGIIYHNAANCYSFNYYPELTWSGGSSVSLGEGFINIPLNLKYNLNTSIKNLSIVPYIGISYSRSAVGAGQYSYHEEIEGLKYDESFNLISKPEDHDTIGVSTSYRPQANTFLLNAGVALEYKFEKFSVFASGNFTTGFQDLNKTSVAIRRESSTELGNIIYQGNKFYVSFGVKVPLWQRH